MILFFSGITTILLGAAFSAVFHKHGKTSGNAAVASLIIGAGLALTDVSRVLLSGVACHATIAWKMPFPMSAPGLELDALSAFFAAIILVLSVLSALFGRAYLADKSGNHGGGGWPWFNLLVVSMLLVATAGNAVLFLMAWELMSLSSFFLVAHENRQKQSRHAAWIYLVATHLGTMPLLVMFLLIAQHSGSLDFANWAMVGTGSPMFRSVLFLMGLAGFGLKAGIYPLHGWLPEAHPAAPSHVSALMSGVMIKTGIYALLRLCSWLGTPLAWWGWLALTIGVVSGIMGIVLALAQHDIKRLLAYSSVENIGIIIIGFGLGLLGWSYDRPLIMAAGFAGCLLHIVNHAVFKSLLFFCAGAVIRSIKSRNIEQMGGLLKRMPQTALAFFVGSIAISGLPPLNGFVSEFLIYIAAFTALSPAKSAVIPAGAIAIAALAVIGGLTAACFARVFGIVFLGTVRGKTTEQADECPKLMRIPMFILAGACVAITWLAPWFMHLSVRLTAIISGLPNAELTAYAAPTVSAIFWIAAGAIVLELLWLTLAGLRTFVLRHRKITTSAVWGCGFDHPDSRMQYTASSFAQPILALFERMLGLTTKLDMPPDYFPADPEFSAHADDITGKWFFAPVWHLLLRLCGKARRLQEGRIQIYLLYVSVTLLVLLLIAL